MTRKKRLYTGERKREDLHSEVLQSWCFTSGGQVQPDQDLLDNSRDGYETKVTQGEAVGDKVKKCRK